MEASVSSRVLKRAEKELAQTKIVLRHLPPDYTEEKFKTLVDPFPACDYFAFVPGNPDLGKFGCARAYINFTVSDDIVPFRDGYDGKILETVGGVKYRVIVELAPYQIIPRGRAKPDHRCGTIFDDPEYKEFVERHEKQMDPLPSIDVTYLYEVEKMKVESQQSTPLTSYLRDKYTAPPRGHRGGGQRNKVLYATGSKRRKDKKDSSKNSGGSSTGSSKGGKSSSRSKDKGEDKKSRGAESGGRGSESSTKVVIVDKQNGIGKERGEKTGRFGSKGTDSSSPKESKQHYRSGGGGGGGKQPDQPLYVPGNKRSTTSSKKNYEEPTGRRKEGFAKNHSRESEPKRRGRDAHKYGRGQYNDRYDNHYEFKEEDDNYQGPDYGGGTSGGRSSDRKPRGGRDYDHSGYDDKRGGGGYGRGRNSDRYDNGYSSRSSGGGEGRYRSYK